MLTNLALEYFKCHEKTSLALAPLTLLTGFNAAGKSTIIQALVVLNQTMRGNEAAKRISLNGSSINLGAVTDVVNSTQGRNTFKIGLATQACGCTWTAFGDRLDLTATIKTIEVTSPGGASFLWNIEGAANVGGMRSIPHDIPLQSLIPQGFRDNGFPYLALMELASRLRKLTYICAERIGPRETYEIFSEDGDVTVGVTGERTAWFLYKFGSNEVAPGMLLPSKNHTLRHQVERRLETFFPGASFAVEPVAGTNLVTLRIRANASGEFYRPQNVGYGLTHVLPIITACVGAGPGDILLIENPEAHLHPGGQSRIGRMLATAAAAGIQVLVETHSDHVLNGIRLAVKEGILPCEMAKIFSFDSSTGESGEVRITSPGIDRNGKIDQWPEGFFDETEKLLFELL